MNCVTLLGMKKKLKRTQVEKMMRAVVATAPELTESQKDVLSRSLKGVATTDTP